MGGIFCLMRRDENPASAYLGVLQNYIRRLMGRLSPTPR